MNDLSELIFDSISDGVFTVNDKCIVTSFNKAAEGITGFKADEAIGKHCFEVFRTEVCHKRCALKDTLKNHDPVQNARVTIISREGCEIPISVTTTLLRNKSNKIIGAVEFFRDISEIENLQKRLDERHVLEDIVSVNADMQNLIQLLPDVAESECNVLIEGPSGSGKELVAQVIHNLSPRKYGPYIKINCAALPASLLESELFGYEKGAFTDAKRDKPGQFCLANGGTLLLDEISEMDISLQVKLLRVLNNGEYQPLGSTKTMRTDARIIAATNADVQKCIETGHFREDLYYRINVVSLEIPPLHDRPDDIPLLVSHFIKKYRIKTRKSIFRAAPETLKVLRKSQFRGNVRELENIIEHAFVMCHGTEIKPEHLPLNIVNNVTVTNGVTPVRSHEKQVIAETLHRNHNNRNLTAKELGVHRSTLWRKIRMYSL
ncbi:MAG: sigma 54-interacting transcriptional regulator [Candidatus Electryonea clarkiae]|nr:sigma 54-interacting transcriptional regulator [Candidatus Electryonea clarkiae]